MGIKLKGKQGDDDDDDYTPDELHEMLADIYT